MYDTNVSQYEMLKKEIYERGKKTKEEFNKIIDQNIEDPIFLGMINDLKNNFSDQYRTALTSFCCEAVGGNPEDTMLISLLISLVSAGYGIHDDIIDNSVNKEFKLTLYGKYGHDYSLTFGNYLLIRGMSVLSRLFESNLSLDLNNVLKEFVFFYTTLIEGEIMEIYSRRNLDVDLEYYHTMLWKISIDGEACTTLGSLIGKGTQRQVSSLREYGKILGYLWRLHEEIVDTLNFNLKLPSRLKYESVPLPILYAAKSSNSNYNLIDSIIKKNSINGSDVDQLLNACFNVESFTYIQNIAKINHKKALEQLSTIKKSYARDSLELLLSDVIKKIDNMCV